MSAPGNKTPLDPFTKKRMLAFVEKHRASTGQLPTLKDFADQGITEAQVDRAVREELLELRYVNLTNGPMLKGYVLKT